MLRVTFKTVPKLAGISLLAVSHRIDSVPGFLCDSVLAFDGEGGYRFESVEDFNESRITHAAKVKFNTKPS